ncbi:MAG: radical SAM protein [Candidatus Omnitrophica bacterium]|nr:radical SAM protein [Candidatus Omnitrophota bacterium]
MEQLQNTDFHKSIKDFRQIRHEGKKDEALYAFTQLLAQIPCADEPCLYNKVLNEIEITENKEILSSYPRRLGVTLTTRCNLECIMCKVRETPWDLPEKTVEEVRGLFPYLRYIMWLGGEVFLCKDFERLYSEAAEYPYLKQAIFTSGILIDEKWARRLVNSNTMLSYSIDGFTKKTYEYIRKNARFEDLVASIERINRYKREYNAGLDQEAKFVTGINMTVMKSNYREIERALDFTREYGFELLTINSIDGVFDAENIFFHHDAAAAQDLEAVIPVVSRKAASYGITLNAWLPRFGPASCASQPECRQTFACHIPWQHLFIDPGGKVRPHCLCKTEVGDIYSSSLVEIWNGSGMQRYRQKSKENSCIEVCNQRCITGAVSEEELVKDD